MQYQGISRSSQYLSAFIGSLLFQLFSKDFWLDFKGFLENFGKYIKCNIKGY